MSHTVAELLAAAQQGLPSDTAALDAQVLLAHVLQKNRTFFFAYPEHQPSDEQCDQFQQLIAARAAGKPVAHLTGEREFWSLNLLVSEDTLIPRPETEHLIECALDRIAEHYYRQILDLGTGTGAIAISLATSLRELGSAYCLIATDQSESALAIAEKNCLKHAPDITLIRSDWFTALTNQTFDLIVSNPPYIAANHPHLSEGDVRFEPLSALVSGEDGLDAIRTIIQQAPDHLNAGGSLILEHGYDQADAIQHLLADRGFFAIRSQKDFAGHDRITLGRWA